MPLPSPISVLLAIPKMESGGSQRVMLNLLRNLDRSRFELHLALLHTDGPHYKDIPKDVSIHHLGVSSARFAVLPLAKLCREWADREKVDLTIDFITSQGDKLALTATAEAQARSGHDVLQMSDWYVAAQTDNLEPLTSWSPR